MRLLLVTVVCMLLAASLTVEATAPPLAEPRVSSFIDPRDGRAYRTLRFAGIEWMRDNLAFEAEPSWCYDDRDENCEVYGRLYRYAEASEACPDRWRLPTDAEWMQLEAWAGLPPELLEHTRNRGTKREGAELRVYGRTRFDALLAGYRRQEGTYTCKGRCTALWSGTETGDDLVWHRDLDNGGNHRSSMWRSAVEKDYALSVRCVRGRPTPKGIRAASSALRSRRNRAATAC